MKYYMLNHGRPFGVEPTVYLVKPIIVDNEDNPFGGPSIEEFNSEFECRQYIKKFYPTVYKEFKVIK